MSENVVRMTRNMPALECGTCEGIVFHLAEDHMIVCVHCKCVMSDIEWGWDHEKTNLS
jgi:transcription initiation factor TFIIIB Brf1 subunit/transcription initiation factor TFIIB